MVVAAAAAAASLAALWALLGDMGASVGSLATVFLPSGRVFLSWVVAVIAVGLCFLLVVQEGGESQTRRASRR